MVNVYVAYVPPQAIVVAKKQLVAQGHETAWTHDPFVQGHHVDAELQLPTAFGASYLLGLLLLHDPAGIRRV